VSSDCYSCGQEAAPERTDREWVWADEHWRVAHAFDSTLPGWLVLVPRRHVEALDELTVEETAVLGPVLRGLTVALRAETGCVKTYVLLLAEAEGDAHLHLHVVPRLPDQPEDRRGPRVFGYLGAEAADRVPATEQDDLARRLRAHLQEELPVR
jgi:diadenosine tetraphosphate (Ap4A) HIT family hydrolase